MSAGPAVAKQLEETPEKLSRLAKGVGSAVGVTGVTVAMGYISLIAAQEFLGIPQLPGTPTELAFAAGDVAMNIFLIMGTQLASHPILSGLLVLIIALTALRRNMHEKFHASQKW